MTIPTFAADYSNCWCATPGRTEDEMYQCPSGEAGGDCLAHDYLAAGGDLNAAFGWIGNYPVPHLADFRDALTKAEHQTGGDAR